MPPPADPPVVPPQVAELVRLAAGSADRPGQLRALLRLTRAATAARVAVGTFHLLRGSGPDGPRLALEFVARLPGPLPPELVRAAALVLPERSVPVPIRLAAAGALLGSVPDEPRNVAPIVRAVTVGLSRSRTLERMLQLQGRVEKCEALDALIAANEGRVRMRCPKCEARLSRRDLITHLWHRHRLVYENGRAREPRALLDAVVTATAKSDAADEIDRTYLLTAHYFPDSEPRQVLQALAARGGTDPTQTDRLLGRAAEDGAGLCPVCLSAVPDPIPPLPPPASLADGRVSADGYALDVADTPGGRTIAVTLPGAEPAREPDSGPRRGPRQIAVLVSLPLLLLSVPVVLLFPVRTTNPVWVALWLTLVGWLAYFAVRLVRGPLPDRTARAVDLAWSRLVPLVGRTPQAVRFLTRLCRASAGAGDPTARAAVVFELVQHAAVLAEKGGPYLPWLAAVRVLEVLDQGRMGRERVAGLVGVFEPFLRGELGPAYAEAAAEVLLAAEALPPGDVRRLAVLVVGAAFENGLVPADLVTVGRFCPWFRRVAFDARPDHLALLYAVWRGRNGRPWRAVGEAATAFELAGDSPAAGRRVLADHPDALLQIDLGNAVASELGPVLVTAKGVSVGEWTVADLDAGVELVRASGVRRLKFGPHRIPVSDRVPARVADELKAWLRYRAEVLIPAADRPVRGTGRSTGMLAPLAAACPLCGTQSVLRTGRVGTPWQALSGRPG